MPANEYEQLDVTTWRAVHDEQLGKRRHPWVEGDNSSLWLFKARTMNLDERRGHFAKGDDWSEKVVSELAAQLDIPAVRVELAVRGEAFGVVTPSIVDRYQQRLTVGNEVLSGVFDDYPDSSERARHEPLYSLENVLGAIRVVCAGSPPLIEDLQAEEVFAGYIVLDAIVGNTDRHDENWAVVESASGVQLAPSFDHASSLGFQLHDDEREERLRTSTSNNSVEVYARRAETRFWKKLRTTDAAMLALQQCRPSVRRRWLDLAAESPQVVEAIVDLIPAVRMSDPARAFASELVRANVRRLLDIA